MVPAQQRFEPGNGRPLCLDDGLVVELEGAVGQGARNLALEEAALLLLGLHLGCKRNRAAMPAPLGCAQSEVGAARELVAGRPILRRHRQSNAGDDVHGRVHPDRTRNRLPERIGGLQRRLTIEVGHDQREFIAADAADLGAGRRGLAQPVGNLHQHVVAAGIADGVVHFVEPVEIDRDVGQRLVAGTGNDGAVEEVEQLAVARQAGQRILVSQLVHPLLASGEAEADPAEPPHYEHHKTDEAEHEEPDERQHPVHRRGRRSLALPGEPADDTAVAIDRGLDRAVVIGGLGAKPEPLDARHALDHGDETGLDAGAVRHNRLQRLDGGRQRLPAPCLERVVGLPGQHVAEAGASQHSDDDQGRERSDDPQDQRLAASEALWMLLSSRTNHRSPRPTLIRHSPKLNR